MHLRRKGSDESDRAHLARSPFRVLLPALLPLFSGCTPGDQPLDGGAPLDRTLGAREERIVAKDPCWRRERGAWHFSIGHCAEMLPAKTVTGIWLTGWEVSHLTRTLQHGTKSPL